MQLLPPDQENLAGHTTGRQHLSHSAIGTLLACEQKFRWHYEERLAPNVRPVALDMGAAFADALEHAEPETGFQRLLAEHLAAKEAHTGNPFVVLPTDQSVMVNATVVREASRAYLKAYGSHHQTRELDVLVRLRNPATGAYSRTFDLMCRVDAVADDYTEIIEDKLTSQIPRSNLHQLVALDRQISIEAYVIWRAYGVLPDLIRYRMTLKPGIRQTKKESFEEYLARIGDDYASRPEHYLAEETATRTLDDFLRLEQELWRWAEQVRSARADGVFPRNVSHCRDFGGCQFLPLCSAEPGAAHLFSERPERVAPAAASQFVEREQPKEAAA